MHSIFGDSLVIISWINKLATLNVPSRIIGVMIFVLCYFMSRMWSSNIYIVSITRWRMVSPNMLWSWIWVLEPSLNPWKEWSLIKEIFCFSRLCRVTCTLSFGTQWLICLLCLSALLETICWHVLLRTCLFEDHSRSYPAYSDLFYQGWWEKSAMIRLCAPILWAGCMIV